MVSHSHSKVGFNTIPKTTSELFVKNMSASKLIISQQNVKGSTQVFAKERINLRNSVIAFHN
jgi:hypothetical protein